jgi:regulator of cell morphogenesis and NO signaling
LYAGLEDLERDLHRHIHLENNVLFPQAIEAERTLVQSV